MTPPHSSRPRFSIRMLLAAVAAVAAALATLLYASYDILATVAGGLFLLFLLAALAAVFRRGAGQALAGGFLLAGLAYLAFVFFVLAEQKTLQSRLPTTRSLDLLRRAVKTEVPVEIPPAERRFMPAG